MSKLSSFFINNRFNVISWTVTFILVAGMILGAFKWKASDSVAQALVPIPTREPDTNSPQVSIGAAGVLLNRSHPFHDLILPIGAPEERMFDAIDGRRTIEAIAAAAGDGDVSPRGRAFFEQLWRYDQVTFDASTAADRGSAATGAGRN